MTESELPSPDPSGSIWARLIFNVARTKELATGSVEEASTLSAVEQQTEASRKGGTIWEAVLKAEQETLERLLNADPDVINSRGAVGDCPIHMLFLYGTQAHLNMARYIIIRYPSTITQFYNKSEYYGEVVLHIAIINRNASMVEWLLGDERNKPYQRQQLMSAAKGNFFHLGRPCYYGEYPLAFACCTNQWKIAEILLKYGADMDLADTNGNTVLHLLVIHSLPEVYTKFKERWIQKNEARNDESSDEDEDDDEPKKTLPRKSTMVKVTPLWKRLNRDGFTPFTLAAKLGNPEMFSFLLDERKITQWRFGPVACVLYPLDQLDLEFQEDDKEVAVGALELIVQNAHVELIMHPRLIDLVNRKWERFARRIFFVRFLITLSYLLIFLVTTILDQSRIETTSGEGEDMVVTKIEHMGAIHQVICTVGRLTVLGGAIWKARGEMREMSNLGIRKYFQTTGSGLLENTLACSFCSCIFLMNILRVLGVEAETAVLAIAAIIGWGYMLFFVMAFRLTGPFVVMIYEMLLNDVLRFCIIYMVFLGGFSQAFFVLFDNNGFGGFLVSVKQCFLGMLGDFDVDNYTETTYQYVSVTLLVIYVVVVTILLLNLLIAMMGDTYGNVIEGATQLWHLERARIVFAIENEMSTDERNLIINKYWATIDDERYLQVEEVDNDTFRNQDNNEDEKADDDKEKKEPNGKRLSVAHENSTDEALL